MSSDWVNENVNDTFKVGEWSVAPTEKFVAVHSDHGYIVTHSCEKSRENSEDPWVWGAQLHIACPDCGGKCPDDVITVWEMMK
jgi:hypothetical protein